MKHLIVALAALTLLAAPAAAHKLIVFAFVEDGEVVVTTKFSSGKLPASGEIGLRDAEGMEMTTLPLDPDGETRFPIPEGHKGGLEITVTTGEGHEDYWVLTPADLVVEAAQ